MSEGTFGLAFGQAPTDPRAWAHATRAQIRKGLSELAHEGLIRPRRLGAHFVLAPKGSDSQYVFSAQRGGLNHWRIDADSIERFREGQPASLDALDFIIDLRHELGLSHADLSGYLEETAATLYGRAYNYSNQRFTAQELAAASFQEIEGAITEGHPVFLANNARLGFDLRDHAEYAPECGRAHPLPWVAVARERAVFSLSEGLTYDSLLLSELGERTLDRFHATLIGRELDPAAYFLLPVHPWQWRNQLALWFGARLGCGEIVYVGRSEDLYVPQQSIRTWFNSSRPERRYVKTSLSIVNMGFVRGLSPEYMEGTPAINDWVHALVSSDPYLTERGFRVLREVAAAGYRSAPLERGLEPGSPPRKLLAALWRESPVPSLPRGRRLLTMTALLHRDRSGRPFLHELIRSSGAEVGAWIDAYLDCYLSPLLHLFYHHDLVFMPHGENIILELEEDVPRGAVLKDIGEEVSLLADRGDVPVEAARVRVEVPDEWKLLSIFTDVFDCYFRFLVEILELDGFYSADAFWVQVARCARRYERGNPSLAHKIRRFDLFAERFPRSCLNRLQLRSRVQMVSLSDPAAHLQIVGALDNPLARFRNVDGDARKSGESGR